MSASWFRALGGQYGPGTITVPLKYDAPESLSELEVTASGDHVEDVDNQGMIFDGLVADLVTSRPAGTL